MRIQRIAAVSRFEFVSVVKRWSYLLATFGMPLFLAAVSGTVLGVQTYFLSQRAAESSQFGLVDEAGVVDRSSFVEQDDELRWQASDKADEVLLYEDRDAARRALASGALRAMYVIEHDYLTTGKVLAIESEKTPLLSMRGTSIEPLLRKLLRKSLIEGRLDGEVHQRVISPAYFVRGRLGPEGEEVVDLDEALKEATGDPDEALFFELRSGGRVAVFLGKVPPRSP